ncbi:MAG TPA: hypothetical protein PKY81_10520 [bacterium]|nr:hypothetical protein [bacterium]HPN31381.1 hypothetical protein [bacterium]
MAEHHLKLGKVKESEIEAMRDFFIWFDEEYEKHCDRDFNEYNFCNTFMEKYQKFDKTSSWRRILLNFVTLMDNCVDKNKDTLEFNERLTKAQDFYDGYNTYKFSDYDDKKLNEYIEQFKKNYGKILNDHPAIIELKKRQGRLK